MGWGPGQYAPIHDHPKEGSLMNIMKGPGLVESTFWKPPESSDEDYGILNEQAENKDYMLGEDTQFYSCYSFLQDKEVAKEDDACEHKNQTTGYITKNRSYNLTRGGIHQIRFHKGSSRLHALKNKDKHKPTLTLHHTLGDNRISWWLNNLDEKNLFKEI